MSGVPNTPINTLSTRALMNTADETLSRVVGKGTRYVNNTKGLADDIGSKLGGTVSNAKGKGYKVEIPNGNKPITVRVMEAGSGGRNEPYFRVSIDGKGSLTLDGKISNDRSLTHIDITEDALKQIDIMIKAYKGK